MYTTQTCLAVYDAHFTEVVTFLEDGYCCHFIFRHHPSLTLDNEIHLRSQFATFEDILILWEKENLQSFYNRKYCPTVVFWEVIDLFNNTIN